MDQLKQYLEIAKKQHFWILCGLAVLVPLIASMVANGHLAKVYTDQLTKIKSVSTALDPLVGAPDHPNKEWVDHVQSETERLRANVKDAWETLYKRQQEILKWPADLKSDFIAVFSKPASSDDPRNHDLEPYCERYQNFVKTELSHMADIVKAEWTPGDAHGAGPAIGKRHFVGGPDAAPTDEEKKTYIVYWDPTDQSRLVDAYDWQDPPSPLDVRYAQEELWVLEAIFKSIDRTNVGATGDFDAVVREIHQTLIGYDATDKNPLGEGSGRVFMRKSGPANTPGVSGVPMGQGGPGGAQAIFEPKRPMRHRTTNEGALGGQLRPGVGALSQIQGSPMAPPAGGAVGPVDPDAWLKDGRFVDTNGKPLLGSDWANSATPEFNLMAFKLTVVADEQRWQKLLVELCNSPLPLEVREVRINPNDREAGGGRPGVGGGREPGGTDSVLHNVTLEIDGVAYLMNPPNLAKLGITAAGAAPVAAVPPPATTPPAATPPAAAPAPAPATPTEGTKPPATAPAATPTGGPVATPATAPPTVPPGATAPAAPPAATPPTPTTPTTAPAPAPTTTPPTTTPPVAAPPAAAGK